MTNTMALMDQSNLGEEFSRKLKEIVTHSNTCIMIAMGFDLGLFDVLADPPEPKTCQEIASIAGMKERYVFEWLGAMVTSNIVSIDATGLKFSLQSHQVPFLTKNGSQNGLAYQTSFVANLTKNAYEKVKACFHEMGPSGTSYDDYPGKFLITAKMGELWATNQLASSFISLFPDLKSQLEAGINVIDVGCGMGHSTCALARTFPKSTCYGVDFVEENFEEARKQAKKENLNNCKFFAADVSKLPEDWANHFQYAFMHNVLHDLSHPMKSLEEVRRVLSTSGLMTVVDCNGYSAIKGNVGLPLSSYLYAASTLACLPLSLGAGGVGLGALCGVEKVKEILADAKFEVLQSGVLPEPDSWKHYYHCQMI